MTTMTDPVFNFSKLYPKKSMIFNKFLSRLLLALSITLLFGIGQPAIAAVTLTDANLISQERVQIMPKEPLNLESEVDRFLTSIPSDYHTITSVKGLKNLLKNPQTVLIDVRELSEYRLGYIPNAINIPLRTLVQNLDRIPRDRPVVMYCASGYRSAMGVMTLHLLSYEKVQGFPPSFAGWKTAGEVIIKS
jgi:rhodanese-related sulfurtransferase